MKEFFASLRRLLVAVAKEFSYCAGDINRRLRFITRVILLWPFLFLPMAMLLPRNTALMWIPIIAAIPIIATAWLSTRWPLAVGAIVALPFIGGNREHEILYVGRKGLAFIWGMNAVTLAGALIFTIIPTHNDPTLGPLLFMGILGLFLPMKYLAGERAGLVKGLLFVMVVVVAAILFLGGRPKAEAKADQWLWSSSITTDRHGLADTSASLKTPSGVCSKITQYDFERDNVNEVDVILSNSGGCLGQAVTLPWSFRNGFTFSVNSPKGMQASSFSFLCPNRSSIISLKSGENEANAMNQCGDPRIDSAPRFWAAGSGIAVFRRAP